MSKQDLQKIQTHILKVNLHCQCEGCDQKIKKLLQKIDGVYTVCVDADQGKVVVTGDVDPAKLLKKLKKSGKHAELWGGQKSITYNQNYPINPQFQNSQNQKVQKVSGVGGGGQGQQQHLVAHLQNVKGAHDLKVPSKERKSVKFTLPEEEFYGSDDGSEFDESDDDYANEEEEKGYGRGHSQPGHHNNNKMMPVRMGNGRGPQGPPGMVNGPAHKGIAGGGKIGNHESAKRDDFIDMVKQTKGKNGGYGDNYDDEEEGYSRGHSQPVHHHHNNMMPMMMGNGRGPQGLGGMVNGPAHKGIVDGGKIGNHGSAKRDDFIDMIKQTKGKSGNYGDNDDDDEEERYGHGHGHAKPVHHNNKMMPMVMGNGREPHGPGGMINGLAQKDKGGGGKVGNYGSVKRDDFRDMVMEGKGKSGNFGEAKNGDKKGNGDQKGKNNKGEENIKKKYMKSDGGLLGRLLGILGKKSKGIEASDVNMKKNNGGGNNKEKEGMKKGEDKLEGHGNEKKNYSKSKSKHDFDFDGLSLDKNSKGSKGSNGNGDVGRVGQMGPMGNNSPMDQKAVQGLTAMNGGGNNGGYYQGMQMQPDPYNIQQQQHMAMMMNQHHHHHQQEVNMSNMYPSSSSMMYGRPHPYMNYMPPPPMPSHPMADPITHTFSDENVEGCSIM